MAKKQPAEVIVPASRAAVRHRMDRGRDYEQPSHIVTIDAVERLRSVLQPLGEAERRRAIACIALVLGDRSLAKAVIEVG